MFCNIENFIMTFAFFPYRDKLWFLLILFMLLSAVVIGILLLWKKERRCRKEAEYNLAEMDLLFKDFRKLRHQYNNIFQSVIFYIEYQQWDLLAALKDEILQKTSEQNNNSKLQLLKIKNYRIRILLNKVIELCHHNGIKLNFMVLEEINSIHMKEADLSEIMRFLIDNIMDKADKSSEKELIIRISSDDEGISFLFDSYLMNKPEAGKIYTKDFVHNNPDWKKRLYRVNKIMKRNQNLIFNNYMEDDHFRQEIMIL